MAKQGRLRKSIRKLTRKKFAPKNEINVPQSVDISRGDENYIFDLKGSFWNGNRQELTMTSMDKSTGEETQKLIVKPIDILNEVEMAPKNLDLCNLDDKIAVLKRKAEFIKNHYTKREMEGLISCLEHRKKYDNTFFSSFKTTTLDHINDLCQKYDLVIREIDLFIPELPDVAIDIMEAYDKKVLKITGKKGVYYVISTASDFRDKYGKRDPILLAQSPFGFYYDILGAWDSEMLILSEL